jgi:hypothetical protein
VVKDNLILMLQNCLHASPALQMYLYEPVPYGTRGSSVIISDYGPGDWGLIPGRGKKVFSSSLFVEIGSEAHPASCPVGTRGLSPGGKVRPGRDADHTQPRLVPRSRMNRAVPPLPPAPPWYVERRLCFYQSLTVPYLSDTSTKRQHCNTVQNVYKQHYVAWIML